MHPPACDSPTILALTANTLGTNAPVTQQTTHNSALATCPLSPMSISSSEKGEVETAASLAGNPTAMQDEDDASIYTTYKAVAVIIQLNNHLPRSAYLDTAANCSAISAAYYHTLVKAEPQLRKQITPPDCIITVGDSHAVHPICCVFMSWSIPSVKKEPFPVWFDVVDNLVCDIVIGTPELHKASWLLDLKLSQMHFPLASSAKLHTEGYSDPINITIEQQL